LSSAFSGLQAEGEKQGTGKEGEKKEGEAGQRTPRKCLSRGRFLPPVKKKKKKKKKKEEEKIGREERTPDFSLLKSSL